MGQLLLLFLCKFYVFCSFFSYSRGVLVTNFFHCGLAAQGTFVIIFFICSYFLNCLKSICTIVIKTQRSSSKSFPLRKFSLKAAVFCCFGLFLVQRPQNFQVQEYVNNTANMSTIRQQYGPCF